MTAEDRYEELAALMQQMIPFDPHSPKKSTKEPSLARNLIAYRMRLDGFPVINIARAMGRNHTTIVKRTNNFATVLKSEDKGFFGYFDEVRAWRDFSELVKEADKDKTEPPCSRKRVITLGEFRRMTKTFPDDTPMRVTEGSSLGFDMRPTYNGKEILICNK